MTLVMQDAFAAPDAGTATTEQAQEPYELSAEKMMQDNLLILGLLFFIFYFMLIRPQQKRVKAHTAMMKGLAKGNRVMTGGGIIGTIVKMDGDNIVQVEIAPNVRVRVAKSSISEVMDEKSPGESANDN